MKVKVMVGNDVILDSSKKQVAKVIEPEPKTKTVNKPKDGIFNKKNHDLVYRGEGTACEPIPVARPGDVETVLLDKAVESPVIGDVSSTDSAVINNLINADTDSTKVSVKLVNESVNYDAVTEDNLESGFQINDAGTEFLEPMLPPFTEEEQEAIEKAKEESENVESEVEVTLEVSDNMNIEDSYDSEDEYDDGYGDDEDAEDYEHYLSNRDRKQQRQMEKQNRRTDFGEF